MDQAGLSSPKRIKLEEEENEEDKVEKEYDIKPTTNQEKSYSCFKNVWEADEDEKQKIVKLGDGEYLERYIKQEADEYLEYTEQKPVTATIEKKPNVADESEFPASTSLEHKNLKNEKNEWLEDSIKSEPEIKAVPLIETPDEHPILQHESNIVKTEKDDYYEYYEVEECVYEYPTTSLTEKVGPSRPIRVLPVPQETDQMLSSDLGSNSRAALLKSLKQNNHGDDSFVAATSPGPSQSYIPVGSIEDQVKRALQELDQEFARDYTKSKHDWLSGPSVIRREIIRRFPENMHPSPKELLDISEDMGATYRMVFFNYERLRFNHNVSCPENDSCSRIKTYFDGSLSEITLSKLPADVRDHLEREVAKVFAKGIKLTVGHVHVLCDITGLHPSLVKAKILTMRKQGSIQFSNSTDQAKNGLSLKAEFDANPFPDPKKYTELAARFNMTYKEILTFFTAERRKHINKNGPYAGLQQVIDETTSSALLNLAEKGKNTTHKSRLKIAKRLSISYITVAFWLDNYITQLKSEPEQQTELFENDS